MAFFSWGLVVNLCARKDFCDEKCARAQVYHSKRAIEGDYLFSSGGICARMASVILSMWSVGLCSNGARLSG